MYIIMYDYDAVPGVRDVEGAGVDACRNRRPRGADLGQPKTLNQPQVAGVGQRDTIVVDVRDERLSRSAGSPSCYACYRAAASASPNTRSGRNASPATEAPLLREAATKGPHRPRENPRRECARSISDAVRRRYDTASLEAQNVIVTTARRPHRRGALARGARRSAGSTTTRSISLRAAKDL